MSYAKNQDPLNLILSPSQLSGASEYYLRRDWGTSMDCSEMEPALPPLEAYNDYSDNTLLQFFKGVNEAIRTDKTIESYEFPASFSSEQAEAIKTWLTQEGQEYQVKKKYGLFGAYVLYWTNFKVPAISEHVIFNGKEPVPQKDANGNPVFIATRDLNLFYDFAEEPAFEESK